MRPLPREARSKGNASSLLVCSSSDSKLRNSQRDVSDWNEGRRHKCARNVKPFQSVDVTGRGKLSFGEQARDYVPVGDGGIVKEKVGGRRQRRLRGRQRFGTPRPRTRHAGRQSGAATRAAGSAGDSVNDTRAGSRRYTGNGTATEETGAQRSMAGEPS